MNKKHEKLEIEKKIIGFCLKNINILIIIISTVAAILVNYTCIPVESGDWITWDSIWVQQVKESGLVNSNGLYPPGFDLLLLFVAKIMGGTLAGFKWMVFAFDLIAAISSGAIVWIISTNKDKAVLAYAIVLNLPSVVFNTSFWGQKDMVYASFILLSVLMLILQERYCNKSMFWQYGGGYALAMIFYGFSIANKQMAVFLLPFYLLYYLKNNYVNIVHVIFCPVGYLILGLPRLISCGSFINTYIRPWTGEMAQGTTGNLVANFTNIYSFTIYGPRWSDWIGNSYMDFMGKVFTIMIIIIVLVKIIRNKMLAGGADILLYASLFVVIFCCFCPGIHDRYMLVADLCSLLYCMCKGNWWIAITINMVSTYNIINYMFGVSEELSPARYVMVEFVSLAFLLFTIVFILYSCRTDCLTGGYFGNKEK